MTFKQYAEKQRKAIKKAGDIPVRATYDNGGNCIFCGEAGRCPGYHSAEEISRCMGRSPIVVMRNYL